MNQKLAEKCYQALKSSDSWTSKTKENDRTISNLICPVCGDKSAWSYRQEPYAISCNRQNECGINTKTVELFNLTLDIEKEYPSTSKDEHRPAREYLKSRGIDDATLDGLDYRYWQKTRKGLGGAAMFPLGKNPEGKETFNGRLLNPPKDTDKTHNHGSTSGMWWKHPAQVLDPSKPVLVVEGIIDALSIIQMGGQAVSVLAAGQSPAKIHGLDHYQLAIAFDNDTAGIRATKKYFSNFPNSTAIMAPKGKDWNDILKEDPKTARQRFKENENEYRFNAELSLSDTYRDYADKFHQHHNKAPGLFLFNGCTYYSFLRTKGDNTNLAIERACKAIIEAQSFINVGTDFDKEFLYQLKVKPINGRPIVCNATGRQLATPRDFKTFLLDKAKVSYEGSVNTTQALVSSLIDTKAPEVRRVIHTGYDPDTKWYVFNSYAVDEKGKIHYKDKAGLFSTGADNRIMPAPQAAEKAITPTKKPAHNAKQIYELFHKAWGGNGAFAFSWTLAGWFVSVIKNKENYFPHISLHGEPAAGKSALTTKLQMLQGRNTEGLPLSQLNTKKGLARTMAGLSGVFTALLEDNQRNDRAFDYSILLTAYNTGSLQVQAKFTNTLETAENPFLSTLMFVQNSEPFNQKAEKQRVVSLHFETKNLNAQTKTAFDELNNIPKEEIAAVMVAVLKHRKHFEESWFNEYRVACADLAEVKEERIRNNHGLILGFHRLFCRLFSIESDIYNHTLTIALEKEKSSAELEINDASTFFEMIYSLESEQTKKYWHEQSDVKMDTKTDYNSLYFNFPELTRLLQNSGLQTPRSKDLQEALRQHPAYIRHGINHRFPTSASETHTIQRKAWHFDLAKYNEIENPPRIIE